jgi:hypothetical protein
VEAGTAPAAEEEAKPTGRRRSRAKQTDDEAAAAKPAGRKRSRAKKAKDADAEEDPVAAEAPMDGEPEAVGDDDGTLSSKPRRRGRRGGRRRSRAKTADAEVTE